MSDRNIESVVVLHIKDDGTWDMRIWGDDRVAVFTIDDNVPSDRVYEHLLREEDGAELAVLMGDGPIGNINDGRVTTEKAQAMKAMLWRLQGGKLDVVEQ